MAALDPLTLPVFAVRCPGCNKDFHKSLIDLVMESRTSCPSCGINIVLGDYYTKIDLEEFLVSHGYSRFHLGTVK